MFNSTREEKINWLRTMREELDELNRRLDKLAAIEYPTNSDLEQVRAITKRAYEIKIAIWNMQLQLGFAA